ncbi:YncE family protein [Alicyclobacillus dauci]|uniref:YncE family protein n=1 Tax=Alicyclobacillus dauci TaxID=1475485 RepID=A0ABY6Z084_9BACL|nr:YncE family protein [Alicyclobacillus dauci]WAH35983.1 YncE family protein [Alicyclobacillus dauci]
MKVQVQTYENESSIDPRPLFSYIHPFVTSGLLRYEYFRIPVGIAPHGLAIDTQRNRLYVNNTGSNSVSIIDTVDNNLIQTVPVGKQPQGLSVDPKTGKVYVANQADETLSVIEAVHSSLSQYKAYET